MSEQMALGAEPKPAPVKMGPDARERVARRKLGNPENFMFYEWQVIGDGQPGGCDVRERSER